MGRLYQLLLVWRSINHALGAVRSAGRKANAVPAAAMTAALAVRKACAPTTAASGPASA